jgi:hypothetical protein
MLGHVLHLNFIIKPSKCLRQNLTNNMLVLDFAIVQKLL